MSETTTGEQIETWKKELVLAMTSRQWRRALQLCSWLRYALRQQDLFDPEVDEAHRRAKGALTGQVSREKAQQEHRARHRQQRGEIMHQIVSGHWEQALEAIDAFHQDGASPREAIVLLQELKARLAIRLSPTHRQRDQRAAALGQHFDELLERVRLRVRE